MSERNTSTSYSDRTPASWVDEELGAVDFGEKRLNKRGRKVLTKLAEHPQSSIPEVMGSWGGAKGAYRLLSNPKVTAEKILDPHHQRTEVRMRKENVVLAVQDTTELNYTAQESVKGLGTIGSDPRLRGMVVHTTLGVAVDRVPLGIIKQQTWIRPEDEYGKKGDRKKKPIEQKESSKYKRGRP